MTIEEFTGLLNRHQVYSRTLDGIDRWFVDDSKLPAGEFAAGPFDCKSDAALAQAKILDQAMWSPRRRRLNACLDRLLQRGAL